MSTSNQLIAVGPAATAAKRAAALIAVLLDAADDADKQRRAFIQILQDYGEQDAASITHADVAAMKKAAGILHEIFAACTTAGAATLLNTLLATQTRPPRLTAHNGSPWHLHIDRGDRASWSEWFIASSALALATLLAEKQAKPGGLCASPACRRPFINLGNGGTRKYCSARCSTRERVAMYRRNPR